MLRVSIPFALLSTFVALWLSHSLGLLRYTRVSAADEKVPEGIESLHRSLGERTRALDQKEAELTRRERTIADKEAVFAQQVDRYEKRISELKSRVARMEATNSTQVEGYRKLYEKMDPKRSAAILEEMEPELVAEILGEMRPQISVEILSRLPPKKVRLLTEKYLVKRLTSSSNKNKDENQN